MLVLILFGFLCGVVSNIIGVGSSLMMVPLLLYIYPLFTGEYLPIQTIFSATLALTFFTCSFGAIGYHRQQLILYRFGILIGVSGAAGSFIGASYISQFMDHLAILILFGIMAILSFIFNLIPRKELSAEPVKSVYVFLGVLIMFVLGTMTGIIGIGGMVILIPYMLKVLRFPIRKTVGTTVFAGSIVALFGMLGKASVGDMNWQLGVIIALGGMLGGFTGPRLARYFPEKVLRWGMNIMLICIIITVILDIIKYVG